LSSQLLEVKTKAVSYLSRREHGVHEIQTKLLQKGFDKQWVDQAIEELVADDYLNESRYVEMMFRHHFERGNGPNKIRYILRQNKVANTLVQEQFEAFDVDWSDAARRAKIKRFGEEPLPKEFESKLKEKARQFRFLMNRGFDHGDIEAILGE